MQKIFTGFCLRLRYPFLLRQYVFKHSTSLKLGKYILTLQFPRIFGVKIWNIRCIWMEPFHASRIWCKIPLKTCRCHQFSYHRTSKLKRSYHSCCWTVRNFLLHAKHILLSVNSRNADFQRNMKEPLHNSSDAERFFSQGSRFSNNQW